ncbi:hypothetical protein CSUI_007955 [Cystoisospora suis]|uniref:Uncharacterized protein n=1 Tax=Cystoisospora suis TaxID=483139 RepID=A0A2C6KBK8_9APIC|nr:hypothetical protein CSUI_007955 [Cystoisospora suis]
MTEPVGPLWLAAFGPSEREATAETTACLTSFPVARPKSLSCSGSSLRDGTVFVFEWLVLSLGDRRDCRGQPVGSAASFPMSVLSRRLLASYWTLLIREGHDPCSFRWVFPVAI